MAKATHSGTCQCCGRQQAVKLSTGKLAKHGYTKDLGFFNGTCYGADELPLEHDATILDRTAENLTSEAQVHMTRTADDIVSLTVDYGGRYVGRRFVPEQATLTQANLQSMKANANEQRAWWARREWSDLVERELGQRKSLAKAMLSHVEMLKHLRETRHGQPLVERG